MDGEVGWADCERDMDWERDRERDCDLEYGVWERDLDLDKDLDLDRERDRDLDREPLREDVGDRELYLSLLWLREARSRRIERAWVCWTRLLSWGGVLSRAPSRLPGELYRGVESMLSPSTRRRFEGGSGKGVAVVESSVDIVLFRRGTGSKGACLPEKFPGREADR